MNVQIPTCEMMARDKTLRLHPDCSWKNVNVFHWIKIVMRISRADSDDPTGKRRRHFEISIDSPFTILNCRATQANTALPEYCGRGNQVPEQRPQMSCGCPDAYAMDKSPSNSTAHLALVEQESAAPGSTRNLVDAVNSMTLPGLPRAAHFHDSPRVSGGLSRPSQSSRPSEDPASQPASPGLSDLRGRPIHLLRHPSFNPPAFDADDPPPPMPAELMTPPPNYDHIIGTPSVDGLADYFTRLADYEGPGQQPRQVGSSGMHDGPELDPLSLGVDGSNEATPTLESNPFDTINTESVPMVNLADDQDSESESGDEDPARPHRRGRVNVANPRTPGGRLVPSRSLEIERPVMRLDMTGVVQRDV